MTPTAFTAPRRWLRHEASRLDASCYATGGVEARERIVTASANWRPLASLADVSVGARFTRTYVTDSVRGVPYLTGSDMLLRDLIGLNRLSRARTPQLSQLTIGSTWTLVSCSGTIGRTVYVRAEMGGMVLSHDAIRVTAHEDRVLPGFLFAFLSSRQAQAMIRQRTYGSVVQHIEPHHLMDLPVQLPDTHIQERIHGLVEQAAAARTQATQRLDEGAAHFDSLAGPMPSPHHHSLALGAVRRRRLSDRLDAFHYIGWAAEPTCAGTALGDLARVWRPSPMKRVFAAKGVPFATGTNIFDVRPDPRHRLARWAADEVDATVQEGDILVQGYGQLNGLIGRAAYVGARSDGWAASDLLFRIRPLKTECAGRIFAFLRSESGRRSLLRFATGNQIPHFVPGALRKLKIPALPDELVRSATRAVDLREQADRDEQRAIEEVEAWLA